MKFFVPYERCRRLCCKEDACFAFLVFENINICLGFTCEEVETVAAFNSFNVNVLCSYGVLCCCEIVAAHRASEEERLFKVALNKCKFECRICLYFFYNFHSAGLGNCGNIVCKCYGLCIFTLFNSSCKLVTKLFFGSFVHFYSNCFVSGNNLNTVFGARKNLCGPFNVDSLAADRYNTYAFERFKSFFCGIFIHCIKILFCVFKNVCCGLGIRSFCASHKDQRTKSECQKESCYSFHFLSPHYV